MSGLEGVTVHVPLPATTAVPTDAPATISVTVVPGVPLPVMGGSVWAVSMTPPLPGAITGVATVAYGVAEALAAIESPAMLTACTVKV